MEQISEKIDLTKLQEEKAKVMKKDREIEGKLCDIKDKLDTLLIEKEKIDKINANIDLRLGNFHEKYKMNKKVQEEICFIEERA